MKRSLAHFLLSIFLVSCSSNVNQTQQDEVQLSHYVLFTVNTQEFIYSEESIETLNRLIDIHEKYEVPVDIYLTEDILRMYEEKSPVLIERLKDSPVVAISYHYRPPQPFHNSAYDFLDLENLPQDELNDVLRHYETHATDPITGESTENPGGYEHVKEVIGYAPVVVGMAASNRKVGDALGSVYKDLGATFAVSHDGSISLGEEQFGLFLRPEDIEVKLFERVGGSAESILSSEWLEVNKSQFLNIKVHDNDFITSQSAWTAIYLKQKPPYKLERANDRELLTKAEAQPLWDLYEACVKEVYENPEAYQAINAFDLQDLLKEVED